MSRPTASFPGSARRRTIARTALAAQSTPVEERQELTESAVDRAWSTVVWNDPVNLMSYVAFVFRSYFGFDEATARRLMLQVHNDGRAVVASGARESMELHTQAMHGYGLWATVERVPA